MVIVAAAGVQIEAMDVDLLKDWYEKVLSLTFVESGGGFYGQFAWGYQVAILPTKSPFQFKKNISLVFRVDGVAEYINRLQGDGIQSIDKIDGPEGTFGFFQDPEGNRLVLWGA